MGVLAGLSQGLVGGVWGQLCLRRMMSAGEAPTEVGKAKFITREQRCLAGPPGGDTLGHRKERGGKREARCESWAPLRRLSLVVKHLPCEGRRRQLLVAPKFMYYSYRRTDNLHSVWLQIPHDLGKTPGWPSQVPTHHAVSAHMGTL